MYEEVGSCCATQLVRGVGSIIRLHSENCGLYYGITPTLSRITRGVGMCPRTQHPQRGGRGGGALAAKRPISPSPVACTFIVQATGSLLPNWYVCMYMRGGIRMTIMGSMGTEGV